MITQTLYARSFSMRRLTGHLAGLRIARYLIGSLLLIGLLDRLGQLL